MRTFIPPNPLIFQGFPVRWTGHGAPPRAKYLKTGA